ncbi:unnamed protein product [Darwinula stevensoni]|uniref:AIG1-type G domain-containing protein n=1 Tax=Darwinula stevensoni TaxID=69355 RepID=A0A7R9A7R5_9CRUS|nr:unnamed protein product [Darwinula stevensoni]CAG0893124.1 unnamed protein product [Darwinula stevensoni]
MKELSRNDEHKVARYSLNASCGPRDGFGRILLLLGASGSGKSTLVNALFNFLMGVKWEEDKRYEIDMTFAETGKGSRATQTKWVTGYTIKSPEYGIITIVDTPGFADTEGLDEDAYIPKQILNFFEVNGLTELCAIVIVVPATRARLNLAEKYAYDSCLKMFGKDATDNFYFAFTFSDCSDPVALKAVKAENISYRDYFQVNNSTLYSADMSENETNVAQLNWDMSVRGFQKLSNDLSKIKPVSLALTTEDPMEPDALDDEVAKLKRQLEMCQGFQKLVDLQKQEMELSMNHTRPNVRRNLLPKLQGKLREARLELTRVLKDLNESLHRLSERGTKSSPATVTDYIQLLVDAEHQKRRPGFRERLQVLGEAKQQAEIICRAHLLASVEVRSEQQIHPDKNERKGPADRKSYTETSEMEYQDRETHFRKSFRKAFRKSIRRSFSLGKKKKDEEDDPPATNEVHSRVHQQPQKQPRKSQRPRRKGDVLDECVIQ